MKDSPTTAPIDVLIIGAGPAGITLARALQGKKRCVIFEMGGLEPCDDLQVLHDGPLHVHGMSQISTFYDYLSRSRQFRIGGSSGHWANYTRELCEIDFERGWPFPKSTLAPYYLKAYELCQVPPIVDPPSTGFASLDRAGRVKAHVYHARKDPVNFAQYRDGLEIRRAEVTDICDDGVLLAGEFVKAKAVVLAAGGIENPRLLYRFNTHRRFPWDRDLGKNFQEHLHLDVGRIKFNVPVNLKDYEFLIPQDRAISLVLKDPPGLHGQIDIDDMGTHLRLRFIMEHAKKSYVFLDVPCVQLRLSEEGWNSICHFLDVLKEDFGGDAEIETPFRGVFDLDLMAQSIVQYGSHHCGTTAMGKVVDSNLELLGFPGIFVLGSSVFPSAGHAPPTLTIVALALRLAEHLETL